MAVSDVRYGAGGGAQLPTVLGCVISKYPGECHGSGTLNGTARVDAANGQGQGSNIFGQCFSSRRVQGRITRQRCPTHEALETENGRPEQRFKYSDADNRVELSSQRGLYLDGAARTKRKTGQQLVAHGTRDSPVVRRLKERIDLLYSDKYCSLFQDGVKSLPHLNLETQQMRLPSPL